MPFRLPHLFATLAIAPLLAVACGSTGSEFDGQGTSGASGASGGTSGTIGSSGSNGGASGGLDGGPVCAAKTSNAARKVANLFFVVDQSLSMSYPPPYIGENIQPTEKPKRWTPMVTALKAFVGDGQSEGIKAALQFFPPGGGGAACKSNDYPGTVDNLVVGMTALPDLAKFSARIPADPRGLATPTRGALRAIAAIAKKYADDHPDEKTAIVLMTDGLPERCDEDDDIDRVAAEVAPIKAVVPTYVIGVSDLPQNLANLKKIAEAGGTTDATLIDTANPDATQKRFLDTINEIRGKTLSCELGLPAPPTGEVLDVNKVNVTFTTGAGAKQALVYDEGCTTGGWRFDAPTAPTKIVLCASACDTFKADPKGAVGVEFGCERRTGVK